MSSADINWSPFEIGFVAAPTAVRVVGDQILWRRDEDNLHDSLAGFIEGAPVDRTIWEFLELKTATAEAFEAFAAHYGVLGIRTDGLPGIAEARGKVDAFPEQRVEDSEGSWYVEESGAWRVYAVALRAVLAASIELRDHDDPDWSTFLERWGLQEFTWESFGLPATETNEQVTDDLHALWRSTLSPDSLARKLRILSLEGRKWFPHFLSMSWMKYGNARPLLRWPDTDAAMRMEISVDPYNVWPANSLFSVITTQLTHILTSDQFDRMNQCSVCGRLFVAKKKPGPKTKPYCDEHRIEMDRERKRRWAQKEAAERKANAVV
jgi:hypothetical protein